MTDVFLQFEAAVRDETDRIMREVALLLYNELTFLSPVDTGRFRANWMLTVGHPSDDTTLSTAPPTPPATGHVDFGDTVFIANNLEYAEALEFGHSAQAPSGIVRVTASRFEEIVRNVAR